MRAKFVNREAQLCARAEGASVVKFSMPQSRKLFSIFVGSVCIAVGLSQSLARTVVTDFRAAGQVCEMKEG